MSAGLKFTTALCTYHYPVTTMAAKNISLLVKVNCFMDDLQHVTSWSVMVDFQTSRCCRSSKIQLNLDISNTLGK